MTQPHQFFTRHFTVQSLQASLAGCFCPRAFFLLRAQFATERMQINVVSEGKGKRFVRTHTAQQTVQCQNTFSAVEFMFVFPSAEPVPRHRYTRPCVCFHKQRGQRRVSLIPGTFSTADRVEFISDAGGVTPSAERREPSFFSINVR
jgi:hypothetical protein